MVQGGIDRLPVMLFEKTPVKQVRPQAERTELPEGQVEAG